MAELIIIPDDELSRLEQQFSCSVRRMGAWNTDGVFGYCSVPISAVERVARESSDPVLLEAASRLRNSDQRAKLFLGLLQSFGPTLIGKITTAYCESAFDLSCDSIETQ